MKTGFVSIAPLLLQKIVASQPHRELPRTISKTAKLLICLIGYGHQHKNRDVVVVTNVKVLTVETEDVVVYVNADGEPWTTKITHHNIGGAPLFQALPPSASKPTEEIELTASTSPLASYAALQPQIPTHNFEKSKGRLTQLVPTLTLKSAAELPVVKASSPTPPVLAPSSNEPRFSLGISYSPYNADGTCKSVSQVANDMELIAGFSVIRLYGTDCDQISSVLKAIDGRGISLFLGIFDLSQLLGDCKDIVDAAEGNWSIINTVSVGNELVNGGKASVGEVTAAIEFVRSTLKASGYDGPVITVDTMIVMKANPQLCQASDFCAINCHSFFDGNVSAEGAGHFVRDWAQQVSEAAGGRSVVIAETGWPTQGNNNNKAVPSLENHNIAIRSIRRLFPDNLILHSAFNDLWKEDSDKTHNAEKFWGIFGNAPS